MELTEVYLTLYWVLGLKTCAIITKWKFSYQIDLSKEFGGLVCHEPWNITVKFSEGSFMVSMLTLKGRILAFPPPLKNSLCSPSELQTLGSGSWALAFQACHQAQFVIWMWFYLILPYILWGWRVLTLEQMINRTDKLSKYHWYFKFWLKYGILIQITLSPEFTMVLSTGYSQFKWFCKASRVQGVSHSLGILAVLTKYYRDIQKVFASGP